MEPAARREIVQELPGIRSREMDGLAAKKMLLVHAAEVLPPDCPGTARNEKRHQSASDLGHIKGISQ
jgi:hypothetical protein